MKNDPLAALLREAEGGRRVRALAATSCDVIRRTRARDEVMEANVACLIRFLYLLIASLTLSD